MTLQSTKAAYQSGALTKPQFIEAMYEVHRTFFDYSDYLKHSSIAAIRIEPEGVIIRFAQPPIEMWCPPGDTRIAPVEALNFGMYEENEFALLSRMIGELELESPVFYDIGANAGFYTLGLSKVLRGLRTYSFEPIPNTFSYLKRNLALNGLEDAKVFNFGLSNQTDKVVFYSYPSQSGASSAARLLGEVEAYEIHCELRPLDTLQDQLSPVDVIKCDVEGGELFVFQGGVETLKKCKPLIFTEMLRKWCARFDYHPNDIIAFLGNLGYECFKISGSQIVPCPVVTEETVETNFFFLHKDAHSRLINLFA